MPEIEEEILQLPKIVYPEKPLKIWNTNIRKGDRIKIVNEEDFPRNQILASLNIKDSPLAASFGITDAEEIKNRWRIMRFLKENPGIINWLRKQREFSLLPTDEDSFLTYFAPEREHTPFWEIVHGLIALLDKHDHLPPRLQTLCRVLKQNLPLEEGERQIGRIVSEQIQSIASIEGLLTFYVDGMKAHLKKKESSVHGYQEYSGQLNMADRQYPEWATREKPSFLYWLAEPIRWLVDIRNKIARWQALREMVISEATPGLTNDIEEFLEGWLKNLSAHALPASLQGSEIKVYFVYSAKGLKIKVISWRPYRDTYSQKPFTLRKFSGYSREKRLMIKVAEIQLEMKVQEQQELLDMAGFMAAIQERIPEAFSEISIPSQRTDIEHRWFALSNLYEVLFSTNYQILRSYRSFFFSHLGTLKDIAKLVEAFSEKAKELNSPLCWPELTMDGEHLLSFKKIFPVHLLRDLERGEIVPIRNLPVLNGNMIGLTGVHEGGKTVTSVTVPTIIYLAQSGLPVFGEDFRFNIKSVLGLVFLTRGEGSTARLLVDKMVRVLKAIREEDPSKVVLIFDELGGGTQEVSGFNFGRDVLATLREEGVSVIFNTQITDLAKVAEEELGAQCVQLNKRHEIKSGIGTGDMEGLLERSGIKKFLKK